MKILTSLTFRIYDKKILSYELPLSLTSQIITNDKVFIYIYDIIFPLLMNMHQIITKHENIKYHSRN
jgi:hypothetical protein